jgi:hypothetical protein
MGKKRETIQMNNPSASSGQVNSGQGNNFFSGFIVGALLGGFIVFLLGTKKGKQFLKAISEEGLDNVSKIMDKAERFAEPEEIEEDDAPVVLEPSFTKASEGQEDLSPKIFSKKVSVEERPKTRRFFRGVSRHAN